MKISDNPYKAKQKAFQKNKKTRLIYESDSGTRVAQTPAVRGPGAIRGRHTLPAGSGRPIGDVAQLGERGVRNAEVVGSNPIISTTNL